MLLYLRPFSPGTRIPPEGGILNDWIGSRSRLAQASLDVQDLVGLSLGCSSTLIRPDGTDGTDGRDETDGTDGTDEWGRLNSNEEEEGWL